MTRPDQDDELSQIRRAAFDLRLRDPAEAVRVLRKILRTPGKSEALAHGALGEILLEDFDDIDGALHHFRKLVTLAPDVPAGHIGLARALARNDEAEGALKEFALARDGLVRIVTDARAATDAETAGAEEALLTALELAHEARGVAEEARLPLPKAALSDELLSWVESARIFDDEEGDTDDWVRYGALRTAAVAQETSVDTALAFVERLAAHVPLPADRADHLRSIAYETAGRWAEAAAAAERATGDLSGGFEAEEVLRAAALHAKAGGEAQARAVLDRLKNRLEKERGRAAADDREAIDALLEDVRAMHTDLQPRLVTLGRLGKPS